MALASYKVITPFEHRGSDLKIGEELVLSERDGEDLVRRKRVVAGRILDPQDEKDAKLIKEAEKAYGQKYISDMARESKRDEVKQDELKERDELVADIHTHADKLIEAGEASEEVAAFKGMDFASFTLEELKEKRARLADLAGGQDSNGKDEAEDTRPAVSDRMKRPDLDMIAKEEGATDEEIAAAKTKEDVVALIEERRKNA